MRSPLLLYVLALGWLLVAAMNVRLAAGPTTDGWLHLSIAAVATFVAVIKISLARARTRNAK